ncbi:hypothetical protein D3C80_1995570 [compost metagenome]
MQAFYLCTGMNLNPAAEKLTGENLRKLPVAALQHPDAEGALCIRQHRVYARGAERGSANI